MDIYSFLREVRQGGILHDYVFSMYLANIVVLTLIILVLGCLVTFKCYSISRSVSKETDQNSPANPSDLNPKEELIHEHWMVFDKTLALIMISLLLFYVGWPLFAQACLFFSVFLAHKAYSEYQEVDLILDHHHIVSSRKTAGHPKIDIDIDRIGLIEVQQNFLGRLLDYGTLIIKEKDQKDDIFSHVKHPYDSKLAIEHEMLSHKSG